jgi:hypothetical protein
MSCKTKTGAEAAIDFNEYPLAFDSHTCRRRGGSFDLFGCGPGPTICPHRSSWLAVGPERRQACGAHRKHGDDRDAHWRAADVPAASRLGRRNLARMFFTMTTVITAETSEAARAKLEPKVQTCDQKCTRLWIIFGLSIRLRASIDSRPNCRVGPRRRKLIAPAAR